MSRTFHFGKNGFKHEIFFTSVWVRYALNMLSWKKNCKIPQKKLLKFVMSQQLRAKHNLLPLHDNYFGKPVANFLWRNIFELRTSFVRIFQNGISFYDLKQILSTLYYRYVYLSSLSLFFAFVENEKAMLFVVCYHFWNNSLWDLFFCNSHNNSRKDLNA